MCSLAVEMDREGQSPVLTSCVSDCICYFSKSKFLHLQNEDDNAYFTGCGVTRKIDIYEVADVEGESWRKQVLL